MIVGITVVLVATVMRETCAFSIGQALLKDIFNKIQINVGQIENEGTWAYVLDGLQFWDEDSYATENLQQLRESHLIRWVDSE